MTAKMLLTKIIYMKYKEQIRATTTVNEFLRL